MNKPAHFHSLVLKHPSVEDNTVDHSFRVRGTQVSNLESAAPPISLIHCEFYEFSVNVVQGCRMGRLVEG